MTREEILAELASAICADPAPEGWYTAREVYEFARERGMDVSLSVVRQRLNRAVGAGRIDAKKIGMMWFYRVGEQGEI